MKMFLCFNSIYHSLYSFLSLLSVFSRWSLRSLASLPALTSLPVSWSFITKSLVFVASLSLASVGFCAKLSSSSSLQSPPDTLDRVVAVVNNEAIPESELNQQLQLLLSELRQSEPNLPPQNQIRKQLLDKLVLEKLQVQRAKETGIKVADTDIDSTIEDIAKRNHITVKQLEKSQGDRGVSSNRFREIIKNQIMISRLQQRELGGNIHVSPEEVDQFLNSSQGQDQSGAEYRLTHILIPIQDDSSRAASRAKTQVDTVMQQIKKGEDFAKLAVTYANNESVSGGDLGYRKASDLPSLFAKIVPNLKVGEVHGPIKNEGGYHIIKLAEKRIDGVAANHHTLTKIHVRHILMKTNEQTSETDLQSSLSKLRDQCRTNADFAKLATKHSEETLSASKGGDLGWVTANSVETEFYQSIAGLRPGEISQPFKTSAGWHIAQVLEARQTPIASQAARNKASELLFQRKVEDRIATWLKRVRDEAEVQIYLNEA
jgi:peptidyl-prolyl cis-trans isomerase SurA